MTGISPRTLGFRRSLMAKARPQLKTDAAGDHRASTPALIVFTDVRGFTKWADSIEVFAHLNQFINEYLAILREEFPEPAFIKGLGDGAMIVEELSADQLDPLDMVNRTLARIEGVDRRFNEYCGTFARTVGHQGDLRLGWGVVRGEVKKFAREGQTDYVGSNVNKCSRLCDLARPFGIALDADDFPELPEPPGRLRFFEQRRILSGLEEVRVWVTEEIFTGFVTRERLRQTPEVHVAGLCIDASGREGLSVLLATRSERRRLFPNLIEGCGGQLAYSETFAEGVARHFRLEMGVQVRVLEDLHCLYEIREPNEPVIPGIRFLCEIVGDKVAQSKNHSKVEWVPEATFRDLSAERFVGNLKEEATLLIDRFKASTSR
ncbi:MAG: NUDIX domain-containing protein [Isosphaeraceae bacterium]